MGWNDCPEFICNDQQKINEKILSQLSLRVKFESSNVELLLLHSTCRFKRIANGEFQYGEFQVLIM